MSKEAKAASNVKIIDEAARLFREQGIEATGVAEVMQAAGLTHGGFYRHFGSKDDLVCAAISKAFDNLGSMFEKDIEQHGIALATDKFIKRHLSEQHVAMPGSGCPIVALGAEAARGPKRYKETLDQGAEKLISLLAGVFDGDREEAQTKATGLMTVMVGTVILARAASSKTSIKKILSAGREVTQLYMRS